MAACLLTGAAALGQSRYAVAVARVARPATWVPARLEVPVIWRDRGVFELQTLVDPVATSGLRLQTAADLNERGQIAVTAVRQRLRRALLLTPLN